MSDKEKDEVLKDGASSGDGMNGDTAAEKEQEKKADETADAADSGERTEDREASQPEEKESEKEDEDLKNQYLRLAADFQNYKRRTEKEKSDIYAYANEKIVTDLLDVIDNFERAIAHQGNCADDSMAEGMSMIFKQLKGVLEKNKVEEIKAQGEEFDPNFHHAVMTENSVEFESGKVTQVLQKGYLLNGKVIRPAMVKVAE